MDTTKINNKEKYGSDNNDALGVFDCDNELYFLLGQRKTKITFPLHSIFWSFRGGRESRPLFLVLVATCGACGEKSPIYSQTTKASTQQIYGYSKMERDKLKGEERKKEQKE